MSTHLFMYPKVSQISARAHTVLAASLGAGRPPVAGQRGGASLR
jgi:hypothetical protein